MIQENVQRVKDIDGVGLATGDVILVAAIWSRSSAKLDRGIITGFYSTESGADACQMVRVDRDMKPLTRRYRCTNCSTRVIKQ